MVMVSVPGTDFSQPAAVAADRSAEFALDVGVDENTINFGNGSGQFQELRVLLAPKAAVEAVSCAVQQARCGDVGAQSVRFRIEAGIEIEPDVGVEAGLMAAVAERHGAAAGLAEVADLDHANGVMDSFAYRLNRSDQRRMAEVALSFQVHDEIAVAFRRQGGRSADAAVVGLADRARGPTDRAGNCCPGVRKESAREAQKNHGSADQMHDGLHWLGTCGRRRLEAVEKLLRPSMTALLKASKSSCTPCTLRFFGLSRLVLNGLATFLNSFLILAGALGNVRILRIQRFWIFA